MKKITFLMSGILLGTQLLSAGAISSTAADAREDIVILYTNDVHCGVNDVIGYDGLELYKREMESLHDHVLLVDAGDAIQGDTVGGMTQGEGIISLLNELDYDVATLGNHEFDYSVNRLLELAPKLNCGYTCCNFLDRFGNAVFEPYRILSAGEKKIAFVGAVTPETFTGSTPTYFQDDKGEYIYSFAQGEGAFYSVIQQSVDSARAEGADVVILLGHLGEDEVAKGWSAQEVAANTNHIDAVIDGHSHSVTESLIVKSKDGEDVTITQTGTKLNNIGKMTISGDNRISTELISEVPAPTADMNIPDNEWMSDEARNGRNIDRRLYDMIYSLKQEVSNDLAVKVGHTDFDLTISDPETGKRAIRRAETNLGDLCADFYKKEMNADLCILNGGSIRVTIPAGDITYETIYGVFPFFNYSASAKVTGQQIIDFLELGASNCPDENGAFAQVSGLSYEIDTSVQSSVKKSEFGVFEGVEGAYRVRNVRLSDGTPLAPDKSYTIAATDYLLCNGGDAGIFSKNCSELKVSEEYYYILFANYIRDFLDGEIPAEYSDPRGQGRITITDGSASPSVKPTTEPATSATAETTEQPTESGSVPSTVQPATGSAATPDSASNTGASVSNNGAVQTGQAVITWIVLASVLALCAAAYLISSGYKQEP